MNEYTNVQIWVYDQDWVDREAGRGRGTSILCNRQNFWLADKIGGGPFRLSREVEVKPGRFELIALGPIKASGHNVAIGRALAKIFKFMEGKRES